MTLAEQERNARVVPRCSPLAKGDDLSSLLSGAGFNLITCDIERIQVQYPSAYEIMRDLHFSAENNATVERHAMGFDGLLATMAIYHSMYQKNMRMLNLLGISKQVKIRVR